METKRYHKIFIVIIFCILLTLNMPYVQSGSYKNESLNNLFTSEKDIFLFPRVFPIHIVDDIRGVNKLSDGIVKGHGTSDDPYVISGWKIDCVKWLWQMLHPITPNNAGIYLLDVHCHVVIENNLILNSHPRGDDHWFEGICIHRCSNITIRNNVVRNASGGIMISDSSDVVVESNDIFRCYNGLVSGGMSERSPSLIFNNKMSYCGDGISCGSCNAEIFANEIRYNGDGIETRHDQSFIHNNYIYGSADTGIVCLESENVLENNVILHSNGWGIFVGKLEGGSSPVPYVNRNTIMFNAGAGIYVANGHIRIENNTISENGNYGIYLGDGRGDISHNTIDGNPVGILSSYLGTVVKFNDINANTIYGIISGHDTIVNYNNIESNKYGLHRQDGGPYISAEYNWWGSADGPGGYGPGSGDPVTYQAIYTPWLTSSCSTAGPIT